MKTFLAALSLLLLAACSGSGSDDTAIDPSSDDPSDQPAAAAPGRVPPAAGVVATAYLATVMDTGSPELCLGAIAESYSPQCSGLPLSGWSWQDQQGVFEKSGDIRWGMFYVTGTFDGETFTVDSAIPAALYDAAPVDDEPLTGDAPGSAVDAAVSGLEADPLPGTLTVTPTTGLVTVGVVHDDGSLQEYADATYGPGTVNVTSALVDIER